MIFQPRLILAAVLAGFAAQTAALTLQEAVRQTLTTNPEVLAARNQTLSRGEEVRQARAGYLPSLELSAGVGRQTVDSPATGGEDVSLTRREASLSARQLLFDGFATSEEVKRQQARESSASYKTLEVEENTALRVAEVYLDLLRQYQLLDLIRETLHEHQNIHDQMVLRSESGVGSKADLDQITARLALAQTNMITAQNNLLDAKTNFYRVTGILPDLDSLRRPEVQKPLPASLETAEQQALREHPTLLSAASDINSAEAQYDASASGFWPRLQLEADKRWDEDIDGIRGDNEDTIVALRMTYNLYSGGSDSALRRQTAYLLEEARDVRSNTQRQVIQSLQLSWSALRAINAQLKYVEMHVQAASDTKSAYRQQFNIGRRTLLDLLNTENEVVDAKRALINAHIDRIFSQYRIFNSMGQLLDELDVERS